MTSRRTTAIGLTAGLLGGGAVGLVLGVPGLTSASDPVPAVVEQTDDTTDTTTDDTTTDDTTTDDTTTDDTTDDTDRPDRAARLREALQELVDAGTITAAQADAVASHLDEQLPERGGRGGPGGPGGFGHHGRPGFDGEVLAELLGIDVAELREQLRGGASIADIAEANGVDLQTVIDALVAEASEHLDLAVESGRLTQEEADEKLADVTERITEMVERSRPAAGDTTD
jgi:hypothetical protein